MNEKFTMTGLTDTEITFWCIFKSGYYTESFGDFSKHSLHIYV